LFTSTLKRGRFTILIFMDNKLTEMEIEEWKDFNSSPAFKMFSYQKIFSDASSSSTLLPPPS